MPADFLVVSDIDDTPRAKRLVDALRRSGLDVTWDAEWRSGEHWRSRLDELTKTATCILVVWTQESVRPEASLVHDIAQRALERDVLLPVGLDAVTAPLGFGSIRPIDLGGWNGSRRNRRFKRLVAAVRAMQAGEAPPAADEPVSRRKRLAGWAAVGAGAGIVGFVADVATMQSTVCRVPGVYSVCSAWGVGGVPTAAERSLWLSIRHGSCDGLRHYLDLHPTGAFAGEAQARLDTRTTDPVDSWHPEVHHLPLTVRRGELPFGSEAYARRDAEQRARDEVDALCRYYEDSPAYRLSSSELVNPIVTCRRRADGHVCALDGQARCHVEKRTVSEIESCGVAGGEQGDQGDRQNIESK